MAIEEPDKILNLTNDNYIVYIYIDISWYHVNYKIYPSMEGEIVVEKKVSESPDHKKEHKKR